MIIPLPSNEQFEETIQRIQPIAIINNQQQANKLEQLRLIDNIPMIDCALPSTRWFVDQLGVLDCLPKPISTETLHSHIRRLSKIETILIVDDDMGFVQLVQRVIEMLPQSYQILRAYDGLRALELVKQQVPDLILLDIAMPELNGFEVITALHDNPDTQDIPIILLTATRYIESESENNTSLSIRKASGLNTSEVLTSIKSLLKAMA